jgi:nicotinate-nucleotide pyrophosphorylase (carboxylating)
MRYNISSDAMFSAEETEACRRLVELALAEDLGTPGDITSQAIIPESHEGQALFGARAPGIVAGLPAAAMVIAAVEPRLLFESLVTDGTRVQAGGQVAYVSGPVRAILASERIALNFIQHLSGIATQTRRYVNIVADLPVKVLDTRKTTPGWRLLEKYAVRCGGGHNHRIGLFDGVLIKDNHLYAGWFDGPKPIGAAIRLARQNVGVRVPIEIEVEDLDEFDQALEFSPDIILIDNAPLDQLKEAVRRRNVKAPSVLLEASGGISLATIRAIAETGVDRISVGALTHSAPALDIALDYQEV